MVWQAKMPIVIKNEKLSARQLQSKDFESESLGPQWQWNYQPRDTHFSLTQRPGWLRLHAFRPVESHKLLKAGNTLTQRSFRSSFNEVTIKLNISHLAKGQRAGLCHMAEHSGALGVVSTGEATYLEFRHDDRPLRGPQLQCDNLWLRSTWGLDGRSTSIIASMAAPSLHLPNIPCRGVSIVAIASASIAIMTLPTKDIST